MDRTDLPAAAGDVMSDLEFFLNLLENKEEFEDWYLRPIQGSYCRLEIFKDGNPENHDPENEIRLYFCKGKLNRQYK